MFPANPQFSLRVFMSEKITAAVIAVLNDEVVAMEREKPSTPDQLRVDLVIHQNTFLTAWNEFSDRL